MQAYFQRLVEGDYSVLPSILMCVEGQTALSADATEGRLYHYIVKVLLDEGRKSQSNSANNTQRVSMEQCVLMLRIMMSAVVNGREFAAEPRRSLQSVGIDGCRAMNLDRFYQADPGMVNHVMRFVIYVTRLFRIRVGDILTVPANVEATEHPERRELPAPVTPPRGNAAEGGGGNPRGPATGLTNSRVSNRRWRELPKRPSFLPFSHNPIFDARTEKHVWMPPQFPTPIISFAKRFGLGCTPKYPYLGSSSLPVAVVDIVIPDRRPTLPQNTSPASSRRIGAALVFEQKWSPLFARYLDRCSLLLWGTSVAVQGDSASNPLPNIETKLVPADAYILWPITWTPPVPVVAMSCGAQSCYFITLNNKVYSCGNDDWGQLGTAQSREMSSPVRNDIQENKQSFQCVTLRRDDKVAKIEAGSAFAVAVALEKSRLSVWGQNVYGQCLVRDLKVVPRPVTVDIPGSCGFITDVACGSFFAALLFSCGSLGTWGLSSMLGVSVPPEQLRETETPNRTKCAKTIVVFRPNHGQIVALRAGPWHCLAITSVGEVYSWGVNRHGRLGHGDDRGGMKLRRIDSLTGHVVIDASCGSFHSAVLTKTGLVLVFGENTCGQLGLRGETPRTVAEPLTLPKRAIAVSCGREHTCILLEDGDVMTCGTLRSCGIGLGHGARFGVPRHCFQSFLVLSLASGATHGMASGLLRSFTLQLIGSSFGKSIDERLNNLNRSILKDGVRAVSGGNGFLLILTEAGEVLGIGQSDKGQLGLGDAKAAPNTTAFQKVSLPHRVQLCALECGLAYAIGISTSGRVYSWGWNSHGQLGHGEAVPLCTSVFAPREIVALHYLHVVQVACGGTFAVALTQDGDVFTWGEASYCGRSGSQTSNVMEPMILKELHNIVEVAAGMTHAVALSCDHVIYTWGNGQLGNGEVSDGVVETPVIVTFAHAVRRIGCGPLNTYVITDIGDLFVWGLNENRQCGVNPYEGAGQPPIDSTDPGIWSESSVVVYPTFICGGVRDAAFSSNCGVLIKEDGSSAVTGHFQRGDEQVVLHFFTPQSVPKANQGAENNCGVTLFSGSNPSEGFFSRCFRGFDTLAVLVEWDRPSAEEVHAAVNDMKSCLQSMKTENEKVTDEPRHEEKERRA